MLQIPSPQESLLPYGILVVGLALVVVLIFVMLRRKPASGARSAAPATPSDATAVFKLDRSPGRPQVTGRAVQVPDDGCAYLVPLLDDAGTLGKPIAVSEPSVYIGRDQSRAQIVFADQSVSRLHARLVLESDGVYILHDEGSASGTFVNDERVELAPKQLNSGDLVEFGRQKAIFKAPEPPLPEN